MPWALLAKQFGVLGALTFAFQISAPLSPFWAVGLGFSPLDIGLVSSSQYLGAALFALPAGVLADRVRHDIVGVVSLAALGAALILVSFGTSVLTLAVPFIVIGMARTPVIAVANKSLFVSCDPSRLGTVMALQTMGMPIGSAVAGITVPLMAISLGWPSACVAVGVVMVVMAIGYPLMGTHLKPGNAEHGYRVSGSARGGTLGVVGSKMILRSPVAIGLSVSTVALMAAEACVVTFLLLYSTDSLGFGVVQAGTLLAVLRLAGAFGRVPIGMLGDRFFSGRRRELLLALACLAALSVAMLALLHTETPALLTYSAVAFCGVASLGWFSTVQALSLQAGGATFAGMLNGWTSLVARSTSVVLPPVFGLLISNSGSYRLSWLVLAGAVAGVGVLAYRIWGHSGAEASTVAPDR